MKRLILCFVLLLTFSKVTLSQSNDTNPPQQYVQMTVERHEELRKNVEDYKKLIMQYDQLKYELDVAVKDKGASNERILKCQENLVETQDKIFQLNKHILSLETELDKRNEEYAVLQKYYEQSKANNYKHQARIQKMLGYERRFKTQGAVIGFLSAAIIILIAVE